MIIHHFVTITLMVMSWTANMVRVGTLVLCVHDAVDYFLEVSSLVQRHLFGLYFGEVTQKPNPLIIDKLV